MPCSDDRQVVCGLRRVTRERAKVCLLVRTFGVRALEIEIASSPSRQITVQTDPSVAFPTKSYEVFFNIIAQLTSRCNVMDF